MYQITFGCKNQALRKLNSNALDIFSVIDAIKEKLRQALLKAVDKILDALNVAEGVVREKVKELITKGEVKIAELKEKVLEILANLGITVYDEELMDIGDTIDDSKFELHT